jgi:hypothetical protein
LENSYWLEGEAMPQTRWYKGILLAFLIILPVALDQGIAARQERLDKQYDALSKTYECYPLEKCQLDLTGDGIPERLEVVWTGGAQGRVRIIGEQGEIYNFLYDHTDGTLRTHLAVVHNGSPRLLVYDGASHWPPTRLAIIWDGSRIREVTPIALDSEILSAMAAHDDSGGWNERTVFRPLIRKLRLIAIYGLVLAIWVGYLLWRRKHQAAALVNSHSLKG